MTTEKLKRVTRDGKEIMGKKELVDAICRSSNHSIMAVSEILIHFEKTVKEALVKNQRVVISNFLTFETKIIEGSKMRNPKTQKVVDVPSRHKLRVHGTGKFKKFVSSIKCK
jgi:nucleoid DNA-binding protein